MFVIEDEGLHVRSQPNFGRKHQPFGVNPPPSFALSRWIYCERRAKFTIMISIPTSRGPHHTFSPFSLNMNFLMFSGRSIFVSFSCAYTHLILQLVLFLSFTHDMYQKTSQIAFKGGYNFEFYQGKPFGFSSLLGKCITSSPISDVLQFRGPAPPAPMGPKILNPFLYAGV